MVESDTFSKIQDRIGSLELGLLKMCLERGMSLQEIAKQQGAPGSGIYAKRSRLKQGLLALLDVGHVVEEERK